VPIYRSWLCENEKFENILPFSVVKKAWKSFIVNGYVNRVTMYVEKKGSAINALWVYLNDKQVFYVHDWVNLPNKTYVFDVTQYFVPRKTEDGEKSNLFKIEVINSWAWLGWACRLSAYIDIDVTGTLTETSSFKEPEAGGMADVSGIVRVFVNLMLLMMVMNLLMGMMSMFMGVFV